MLWLALHLPALSLEAFAATLPGPEARQALALQHQHRLTACNAEAEAAGVRSGMRRATALALLPSLRLGQADAVRDAQALQAVAHVALGFTPSVALHGGHSVLLEVQSCLRLWGGLPRLIQILLEHLQGLGHASSLASAPTALGAALLAQAAPLHPGAARQAHSLAALRQQLDALPVWLLGPGREHWEALQGMGLHTLGDLRALPRAGLARRFGESLLADLDHARGERAQPLPLVTLPPRFEARLELQQRADNTEALLHAAQMLLQRLQAWVQAHKARVQRFVLRMQHEPRHRHAEDSPTHTDLAIALAEPSFDALHLQTLLREHLGRLKLPAPTLALQLHCQHIVHTPAPNGELFLSRSGAAEAFGRLVERLQARLGTAQVLALHAIGSHVPERASQSLPLGQRSADPPATFTTFTTVAAPATPLGFQPPEAAEFQRRPTWLLNPPQPLPERDALPWLGGHALQLLLGPERIETAWWESGGPVLRDYYIAQAADHSLVWVYRLRVLPTDAPQKAAVWFLQGRFG